MKKLLLASSSPYRRALLQQLNLDFEWASPDINETQTFGESAAQLVERLSLQKAKALAERHPTHLIIGSDQVACIGNDILTKPGNFDSAFAQLSACSGRSAAFYTGVAILDATSGRSETRVATTQVAFRHLTTAQIKYYLNTEQPYDCAGSFKCEGLGISLFQKITSDDPTALIGIPLISLTELLSCFGQDPLKEEEQ